MPAQGGGRGQPEADRPGPEVLAGDGQEGPAGREWARPGTCCSPGPGRVMAVISTSSLNSYQGGIHICGALGIGFGIPEEYFP